MLSHTTPPLHKWIDSRMLFALDQFSFSPPQLHETRAQWLARPRGQAWMTPCKVQNQYRGSVQTTKRARKSKDMRFSVASRAAFIFIHEVTFLRVASQPLLP